MREDYRPQVAETDDASYYQVDVPFGALSGWIGTRTNGAAPRQSAGFRIEADTCLTNGEASAGFWLKALGPDGGSKPDQFLFTETIDDLKRLVGTIVEAATNGRFRGRVAGDFGGWRNDAQLDHDPEASEECHHDLACHVDVVNEGMVEVSALDAQGRPVARIVADVDHAACVLLSTAVADLEVRFERAQERLLAAEAPSPSP